MTLTLRRPRAACVSVVALATLLLPAAPLRGDADANEVPAFTCMANGPLRRATLVVLAEIEEVREARGMVLAHVRARSTLKGTLPTGARLTIFVRGPRPTEDPKAPSAPYLLEGTTGRYVFFLTRRPEGVGYFLDSLFPAEGDLGAEKTAVLEQHVRLTLIHDVEERARRTLAFLLDRGRKGSTWTRVHAARELAYLAGVRPDLFDAGTRDVVRGLARRTRLPTQRTWLRRTLQTLGGEAPAEPADDRGAVAPPTGLEAALEDAATDADRQRAYERFLHEGGAPDVLLERARREPPATRAWLVTMLADGGFKAASARIRRLYAMEDDAGVQRAIVRALGLLGGSADVAWLAARVSSARVHREALFALARIRTPGALAALSRVRQQAERSTPPRDGIVALVDYLMGTGFIEVEAAAGRSVGTSRPR